MATSRTYRPRPRGQIRSIAIRCVPEPAATPVAVCVRQFRTGWGMQSNATPRWAESTTAAVDAAAIGHLSGSGLALAVLAGTRRFRRSEEHTSELQSLMRISYAVFCLKKKKT